MFEVMTESYFSAAHNLRNYRGKCEKVHGHNWKVQVFVRGEKLNKQGLLLDFHYLRARVETVIKQLDHTHLNRIKYFKRVNPSSENIAGYLFSKIKPKVTPLALSKVAVWESEKSCAVYSEDRLKD